MSRLKGADLGVIAGNLNYRGAWSGGTAYAVNDVVSDTYGLYSALSAVPSGSGNEPSLTPTYPGSGSGTSATQAAASGNVGADSVYNVFTVNTTTTISSITVYFNAAAGHFKVGIASSVGANPNAVVFLSSVTASNPSAGNNTFTIPAVTLSPGTTYYIVFVTTDAGSGTTTSGAYALGYVNTSTPAPTGNIVPGSPWGYSTGTGSGSPLAWTAQMTSIFLIYTLNAGGSPYWQKLAVTSDATSLHYRGSWSSATTYAANDVVFDAYGLYAALLAVPSGLANEPILSPTLTTNSNSVVTGANSPVITDFTNAASVYQAFTTGSSSFQVDSVTAYFFSNAPSAGTFRMGIASSIGTSDSTVTWVGATPPISNNPATAASAANPNTVVSSLAAPITLQPNTTYYFVAASVSGAGAGGIAQDPSNSKVPSGGIASIGADGYANGDWLGPLGRSYKFSLASGTSILSYWQKIANASNREPVNAANSGTAITLVDVDTDALHRILLTANATITLPTPGAGKSITVVVVQDATGGRTLTFSTPSGTIKTAGGTAAATWSPTVTSTAGKEDVYSFLCTNVNWLGLVAGQNF